MKPLSVFLLTPVAVIAPAAYASVYLTEGQAQQALFPGGSFADATMALNDAQARAIADRSGVPVRNREQRVWRVAGAGWFIVDEVVGKHEFITYAVGLDASGKVRGIEIMEYRENYGYEIRNADWRRQFVGKSAGDPLRLEQDIGNISGATLSCRHVTEGVRRLLALYEIVLRSR